MLEAVRTHRSRISHMFLEVDRTEVLQALGFSGAVAMEVEVDLDLQ